MRHDHEKLSSGNADTNGVFHNVQPLRDLQSNWEVNLAKRLEDYLLKICSEKRTTQEVYQHRQRKMLMMKRMIHFGSQRKSLWTKNMLDGATYRDASLTQFVKDPANLVVLEDDCQDSTGDSGELESYLLATCDIYQDFILLDSCDAVAVDSFLNNDDTVGKGLNNSCRGNSVGSKNQKSFLSPTRCSAGTANKFSARKNQGANFYVSPRVEPEFDPGSYNDDSDMPDNCDDGHGGEDGYVEPRDADDSDDEDPWKPLNPHEPGTLKVKPYRKVDCNRRQGMNSRKRASLASEFPLARLHGTISSDINDIWEKKFCAMKKRGDSESPFEKEINKENEYDGGDNDFGQPDYDVPESADANEDVTQHAEKHEDCSSPFDKDAHEDPYAHSNLEDLCRSHLDSLLANLAETEKQSELAARVSTWKQRIEENLEEQICSPTESHPPFDIAEYRARVLSKLSLEGNSTHLMSFSDVVLGQKKHDVGRTFSALLQLINNGDVDLERG